MTHRDLMSLVMSATVMIGATSAQAVGIATSNSPHGFDQENGQPITRTYTDGVYTLSIFAEAQANLLKASAQRNYPTAAAVPTTVGDWGQGWALWLDTLTPGGTGTGAFIFNYSLTGTMIRDFGAGAQTTQIELDLSSPGATPITSTHTLDAGAALISNVSVLVSWSLPVTAGVPFDITTGLTAEVVDGVGFGPGGSLISDASTTAELVSIDVVGINLTGIDSASGFDYLALVPEPASAVMLILGASLLLRRQ